MKHEVNVNNI